MTLEVLHNPAASRPPSGFSPAQFRKLDEIYCAAASRKALIQRSIECDFDEGILSYTYYRAQSHSPYLQFVIRRLGPRTTMYELYLQGKGRVAKSGDFARVIERLRHEVEILSLKS